MGIRNMQGTSAFIEYHWEAMPKHEFSVSTTCLYSKDGKCTRSVCPLFNSTCVGYTKCSFCISPKLYTDTHRKIHTKKKKNKKVSKTPKTTNNSNVALNSKDKKLTKKRQSKKQTLVS